MQQALEALEMSSRFVYTDNRPECEAAIAALRAALAEQAQPMSEAGWLHRLDMEKSEAWMAGYAQGQKRAAEQAQPVAEVGWAAGRPNTIIEYRWLDWDHPPEPGMTLFAAPPRPSALAEQAQRVADEREWLIQERDHARAQFQYAVHLLTGIHSLLYPAPVTTPDGRTMVFRPENPHEFMQALSDRIRALPDELAAAPKAPTLPTPQSLTEKEIRTLAMEVDSAGGSVTSSPAPSRPRC